MHGAYCFSLGILQNDKPSAGTMGLLLSCKPWTFCLWGSLLARTPRLDVQSLGFLIRPTRSSFIGLVYNHLLLLAVPAITRIRGFHLNVRVPLRWQAAKAPNPQGSSPPSLFQKSFQTAPRLALLRFWWRQALALWLHHCDVFQLPFMNSSKLVQVPGLLPSSAIQTFYDVKPLLLFPLNGFTHVSQFQPGLVCTRF